MDLFVVLHRFNLAIVIRKKALCKLCSCWEGQILLRKRSATMCLLNLSIDEVCGLFIFTGF